MKRKNLIYFGLMIILIISISNLANGTTNSPYVYVAKAGDSRTYTLSKYFVQGSQSAMNLVSGPTNLNIKVGTNFTVTVCNVTGSGSLPQQTLFTKITYDSKTTSCVYDDIGPALYVDTGTRYVKAIADNKSYYSYLTTLKENNTIFPFKLNGNIFTQSITIYNSTFSFNITESWDITTGWLIESSRTNSYRNGTITLNIDIKSITNSNSSNNGSTPGFETISVFGVFAIVTPVVIIKRKRKINNN